MANIGVAKASIYADLSATKFEKEAIKAVERVAKTRTKSSSGDQVKFSAMEDTLRLDIAAKNGAIRSMTAAQGYLLATMNALDSGDYILKELHDLAVQASDGNKTANELSALDVGAEILGDEFHKLMTSANFKGKPVFSETNTSMKIGTGVQDTSIGIGIKQVEYDDLYDHTNSPTSSITPGIRYEIIEPLTNDQKETILARTSGLNAAQLVVGAQFTVTSQAANGNDEGVHTRDLYYTDGDGSVPFDATAKVSRDKSFGGGYLDIEITQNAELSDSFTLVPGNGAAGTITVNSNVVSYVDPIVGSIEIGTIDGDRNGQFHEDDNPGAALRINFYPDATIPGTSNISNGDFSGGGSSWNAYEDRVDFGSTFTVNGMVIPTPSEADMQGATKINEVNNTPSGHSVLPGNDNAVVDPDHHSDTIDFSVSTADGHLKLDTDDFWFENHKRMRFEFAGFANDTDTFSANLSIDFGYWTKNSDNTYTFTMGDPGRSTNLNFANKTINEVNALINGINGLSSQAVDTTGNGENDTIKVSSQSQGLQNGFRISGSGAAQDERWTTPTAPNAHAHNNTFTQLSLDKQKYGILHGPATVSDPFEAEKGDFLKLGYIAQGSGDWYHVASYIVDSSGTITMALNEYGFTTNGENYLSVEVPKKDTYQFVFVNGTWDMSGGRKAGASMLIDDIRAERPYTITDSVVEKIMTSTNYSSSSNDQKYIKDVKVIAKNVTDEDEDTSKIFNTEYDNRIMVAPTLNLEKPVSFGASNNLGPGGTTDPYVVVSKIEEVQTRIGSAKAEAKAHYAVLESAIDSSTDMRAQFFWGADAISDPEFFADTAYFAKQQIMQDNAAAILAQANKSQGGLMQLVDSPNVIEA